MPPTLRLLRLLALSGSLVLGAAGCRTAAVDVPSGAAAPPVRNVESPGAPVSISDVPDDWAPYVGRLVTIAAELTVDGTYAIDRFGEVQVSFGDRLWVPTEVALPGEAARALAQDNARRRLVLDDGLSTEVRGLPAYLPDSVDSVRPLRTGSVLTGVTGRLEIVRSAPRLLLTEPLGGLVREAPRPPAPRIEGAVRIAAFNVLNLFNGDGSGGGFPTDRGAATPDEYALQRAKIVAAVQELAPDIAALQEIENDGYGPESSLAQFVDALNAAGPAADWRFVTTNGRPGTDAIRVALIYRASRVAPVGTAVLLEEGPFRTHSRVPVAQAFTYGDRPPFVVVANHFKSKGCGRDDEAATGVDADQRDGQGCWNAMRVESARQLVTWLQGDPTGAGTDRSILLGDFNAYAMEDPIRFLAEAGWADAFVSVAGAERPYSYVYGGERGRLDHALVSRALANGVRSAAIWNSNSDELRLFGYERGLDSGPYRASDHDPLVVGIDP